MSVCFKIIHIPTYYDVRACVRQTTRTRGRRASSLLFETIVHLLKMYALGQSVFSSMITSLLTTGKKSIIISLIFFFFDKHIWIYSLTISTRMTR